VNASTIANFPTDFRELVEASLTLPQSLALGAYFFPLYFYISGCWGGGQESCNLISA
jgi:hypothetical protein